MLPYYPYYLLNYSRVILNRLIFATNYNREASEKQLAIAAELQAGIEEDVFQSTSIFYIYLLPCFFRDKNKWDGNFTDPIGTKFNQQISALMFTNHRCHRHS